MSDGEPEMDPDPAMDPSAPEPGALAPEAGALAPGDPSEEPAPPLTDPGDIALLALIDRLAGLLDRSELSELEVQVGGTGIVLRKPVAIAPVVPASTAAVAPAAGQGSAGAPGAEASAEAPAAPSKPSVKAPLTGIWYGSPSPGSAPYVTVGGEVAAGQVIGLIEAMKLFNEIKSDLSGRVVRIHAEPGKLVKARQPLIEVEPL
ncbi:MAG: acetyl-CoA carboxylase biotin carboxyl carrier protein [Chloroflexi bacterium]|nr:acetyl-CoA carboxylase biotin carboxyl carrier protein [Chloroflexota bacterium]